MSRRKIELEPLKGNVPVIKPGRLASAKNSGATKDTGLAEIKRQDSIKNGSPKSGI